MALAELAGARGDMREAERAWRYVLEANPLDATSHVQLADVFGQAARKLTLGESAEAEAIRAESNIEAKRRGTRQLQINAYRQAWGLWESLGFEHVGGTPAIRDGVIARWFVAALDRRDVLEGHTTLVHRERVMGEAPTPRAVLTLARDRLALALLALEPPPPDIDPARHARGRAQALLAVGLDPRKPEATLQAGWIRRMQTYLARAEVEAPGPRGLGPYLQLAGLQERVGDRRAAAATLRRAAERYPGARWLLGELRRLEASPPGG